MKIAILTSGIMPVPAVKGGAVENLIDFYLEYNNQHHIHEITVFCIWHSEIKNHHALSSEVNSYNYIRQDGIHAKISKYLYHKKHQNEYYHYSIEYFFEQAYKKIKKGNFDLIIVENRPGFALKLQQRTEVPCALHLHNDFLCVKTSKAKEIYDGFNRIICVSDFISQKVQEIGYEINEKCITVHNAIDVSKFEKAVPANRSKLGFSNDDFIIVFSGRLIEEKGILQLIKAFNQLQEISNIKLLIIGASAYGKDNTYTPFSKQLLEVSGPLKDRIIYAGFIKYEQVPSYLKMANLAVIPSIWEEPFGLTVVEAMAAGLPLITTRSGGIPEICEGVATIVKRENIVDNLADAILDLYNHPEKRKEMSNASLKRSKLFDKETYARNFLAALEDVK